jgi:hypothetical protein
VAKAHTDVKFNTSTIPYARQFDETAEEVEMDLVQYIAYMSELAGADDANAEPPQYIFSSLSAAMSTDSTLYETILHMDPPFVDWNKMLKNSPQFYLGPPGTGAFPHACVQRFDPRSEEVGAVSLSVFPRTFSFDSGVRFLYSFMFGLRVVGRSTTTQKCVPTPCQNAQNSPLSLKSPGLNLARGGGEGGTHL